MPALAGSPQDSQSRLVLVTGSGRSGTSTVAGALKRLGLYIPQPENEADAKNPRGYYEPAWVTRFNKRLLGQVGVHNNDARPEALELCADLVKDPSVRAELDGWLGGQLESSQILIKDPHILWLSDLWTEAAAKLEVAPCFLTTLRHPAEVVGSRDLAYLSKRSEQLRRLRETANVAGWVNIMLTNERASRHYDRAFLRYSDLMTDWRTALREVATKLDLALNADLSAGTPHEVDDFIDTDLWRSHVTWDDLNVAADLRDLAESVWSALDTLVEKPDDPQTLSRLDELRDVYDQAHAHAVAFAHYDTESLIAAARREVREQLAEKHQKELAQVRQRMRRRLQEQSQPSTLTPTRRWAQVARGRLSRVAAKVRDRAGRG
jgi:hypothetical protein